MKYLSSNGRDNNFKIYIRIIANLEKLQAILHMLDYWETFTIENSKQETKKYIQEFRDKEIQKLKRTRDKLLKDISRDIILAMHNHLGQAEDHPDYLDQSDDDQDNWEDDAEDNWEGVAEDNWEDVAEDKWEDA